MGYGSIIADAMLGAVAGGSEAAYQDTLLKQKEEMANKREALLSRLRMDEHTANTQSDINLMPARAAAADNIEAARGQKINEGATGILNSQIASRINSTTGSTIDPNNPDSKATIEAIRNNPEAAKAYGVEPDSDIVKAKARADAARNQGNLAAAREEDQNVRNLVTDKRNEKTDETTNRRLDIAQQTANSIQERQQTLAEAQMRHMQVTEANAKSRDTAAAEKSQRDADREARAATAKALDGANADLRSLEKEAASMENLDPAKQKVIQAQIQSLRGEAAGYRRALAGAGITVPDAPAKPPGPKITDPFAPKAAQASDAQPAAKPAGVIAPRMSKEPADPMATQYEREQREMDAGTRQDFSAEVKAWFDAQSAKRTADRTKGDEEVKRRQEALDRQRRGM